MLLSELISELQDIQTHQGNAQVVVAGVYVTPCGTSRRFHEAVEFCKYLPVLGNEEPTVMLGISSWGIR